jgi:hypothetical protein
MNLNLNLNLSKNSLWADSRTWDFKHMKHERQPFDCDVPPTTNNTGISKD